MTPHISSEGGVTRRADRSAFPWCADYAATANDVPTDQWCTLGFTYDGKYIRAYINGKLDELTLDPVKHRRTDKYFTHEGPNGGDRGMNPYYHGRGIFRLDPEKHADTKIGGADLHRGGAAMRSVRCSVKRRSENLVDWPSFHRALSSEEMQRLHASAHTDALNR